MGRLCQVQLGMRFTGTGVTGTSACIQGLPPLLAAVWHASSDHHAFYHALVLMQYVRDGSADAPQVTVDVDTLTFDRVLLFLEAHHLGKQPPQWSLHLLDDLAKVCVLTPFEGSKWSYIACGCGRQRLSFTVQGSQSCCGQVLNGLQSRIYAEYRLQTSLAYVPCLSTARSGWGASQVGSALRSKAVCVKHWPPDTDFELSVQGAFATAISSDTRLCCAVPFHPC